MFEALDSALDSAARDLAITDLIDTALDDLKHQRIVDTNKVTNWLLDIRNLVDG